MAASVGDALDYLPGQLHSRKDALKALRHTSHSVFSSPFTSMVFERFFP